MDRLADKAYKKHLEQVVNNNRFLILPWVSVKNMASKTLSIAARQLADDWHTRHGYRPVLLETFIDSTRFNASCYRAANWYYLGQTQIRAAKTTKAVYIYPLHKHAQSILINGHQAPNKKHTVIRDKIGHSNDPFIQLWQNFIGTVTAVASDFDAQWQKRQRILNSLLVVLFIVRLVFSKNHQGYGITIAERWDLMSHPGYCFAPIITRCRLCILCRSKQGGIPVGYILSSASLHDSQVAIPLTEMAFQRVTSCYDLMDAAYDSPLIKEHSEKLGQVQCSNRHTYNHPCH